MPVLKLDPPKSRIDAYLRYKVERGMASRYPDGWVDDPDRAPRLERELALIEKLGFSPYFLILADIMDFCRRTNIPYGPGRGSVGGCYAAYALGIHEVDSLEWGLLFERFLNEDRVVWPDVDLDFSQRHRKKVLDYIRFKFENEDTAVLQVAAFARASGRSVIDMMLAARNDDGAIAENLRKCLPEGNITGGTKQPRELAYWIAEDTWDEDEDEKEHANQRRFVDIARQGDWYETMLKLDGIQTHLAKHAAGVVILSRADLARLPQCGAKDTANESWNMMTGYDMYALEDLNYLKIDALGLRTLDLIADAHKMVGGDGSTPALIKLWQEKKTDPRVYELLRDADTLGVFQVETGGYRRTLKKFKPETFEHIVQLNALYRPGALDFVREEDKKNMVEVFIERKLGKETIHYPSAEMRKALEPILDETQGIILYQEQAMQIAVAVAGFDGKEADRLRKAIGKKQTKKMKEFKDRFVQGAIGKGHTEHAATELWNNIAAAARYSWNKSHSVEYGIITWLCAYFKAVHPAAYYTAFINSWSEKKEKQSEGIAEARQRVEIAPPDINIADGDYTVIYEPDDTEYARGRIVFGLNGIKGMGEANRAQIVGERSAYGPYSSFEEFQRRLPSVPINMKLSLIRCGAFDNLELRSYLLARIPRPNKEPWTVAEFVKHNTGLKKPRELPDLTDLTFPSDQELATGELETIGFYVSSDPMPDVSKALARLDTTIHWGGMIEFVNKKRDKNEREYATATMLTSALTKVKLTIFASVYPRCLNYLKKESRVVVRGRLDGSQVIVDAMFPAGDYRHFKIINAKRGEEEVREPFDGELATIERFESSGFSVTLL